MKLFLLKRKRLAALACVLAAGVMFAAVNSPLTVGAAAAKRQLPIYCVQRDQKMLSISFDAAWGNEDTQQLIDILGKYDIKATFFVVGEWVDKYPESVKALSDAVTGVRPTLIRPPYGEYDDNVVSAIRSMGMEPIQWDVDSLDWKDLSAAEITKRVTTKVQSGSIVLFHNAAKHTPEALPTILEDLLQQGYTFVPISQLILPGQCDVDYTIDHTGKQCPA